MSESVASFHRNTNGGGTMVAPHHVAKNDAAGGSGYMIIGTAEMT